MAIKCCNGCKPPKRTPTCHGTCPEYAEEKAKHDAEMAKINKAKYIYGCLYQQTGDHVAKANRRKKIR